MNITELGDLVISLTAKVDALSRQVELLSGCNPELTVKLGPHQIEEMYGLAGNSIYTYNRSYLPDYGYKEGPNGKLIKRWTRKEVLEWNLRPLNEREEELRKLPL